AVKKGVAVVVANGNAGPENWTVGAPATARGALSVGAYQNIQERKLLVDPNSEREIPLTPTQVDMPWDLDRDYEITDRAEDAKGKIGIVVSKNKDISEVVKKLQEAGAKGVLLEVSEGETEWLPSLLEASLTIP